jgi:lambda repressor-like predicted transcriptional regulator
MDDSDTVRQERLPVSDWHPPHALAALKKRGHSLAGLSAAHGYHPTAAGKALTGHGPP